MLYSAKLEIFRLGWKCLSTTNALAYFQKVNNAQKSFTKKIFKEDATTSSFVIKTIMAHSITTLSRTALSIMTRSITDKMRHSAQRNLILNVIILSIPFSNGRQSVDMLSVVMLSVVMLSVVMPSVVAPLRESK